MIKLIFFEYRKHFLKTSIIISVLLFSILNIIKIYGVYDSGIVRYSSLLVEPEWKSLYWEMYEDFGGKITDEKIKKLMAIYQPLVEQTSDRTASTAENNKNTYTGNIYKDTLFFGSCFVRPMEYAYMYRNYANTVTAAAGENMALFTSLGNTYEYRKNSAIVDIFNGREIKDFTCSDMYQYYLYYDFSVVFVLLICLYSLMSVFISEKETEMDTFLLTSKCGGAKTVLAKILASIIFVCSVCLWFCLVDFIAFSSVFGLGSLKAASSPLYVLENFSNASVNISLGQYTLLSALIKIMGILLLSLFFLLVSCFFKNALLPFLINLTVVFGLIYLHEAFISSGHILLKIINPFTLIVNRGVFRQTEFLNVFNFPVISYVAVLLCAAVWGIVLISGIMIFVKKSAISRKRS